MVTRNELDLGADRFEGERLLQALGALHAMLGAVPEPARLAAELRLCLIAQIDDDARAALDSAAELRLRATAPAPVADRKAVALARDVFGALLDLYQQCLEGLGGEDAAECRIRLVRAGAERLKWERCAGGPAHPALWSRLGAAFARAVAHSKVRSATAFGAGGRLGTSVEREYLRAVAVYSAAYDRISPDLVAVLDRLIEFSLPMLDFRADSPAGAVCHVAPDLAGAPRRVLPVAPASAGAWFLATRVARGALQELAEQSGRGLVPMGLECAGRGQLTAALHHLLSHWSEAPRMRSYRRHVLGGRLTAVRGIDDLRQLFAGESVSCLAEWEFRDVSRGGIGVALPPQSAAAVAVGELVGVLPHDGDVWQFGIVKRAWTEADASMVLGLEALAHKPVLVSADDGLVRADVFLCDPLLRGEAVRVAAPASVLRPDVPLSVAADGAVQQLKPLDGVMSGEGFELRVYQVV